MAVSRIGDLACPYCKSRNFFTDKELHEYKNFRIRVLEYLSAMSETTKSDEKLAKLWRETNTVVFTDKDGTDITVKYIYKSVEDEIWMYSSHKNVIYIYPSNHKKRADSSINIISELTFPQADMKGLYRCFPVLTGRYELEDGRIMVVYSKDENLYPVAMFGNLVASHVEWIISRLENIACVLEFNDMTHGGITQESVFINPITHEVVLFGGWHKATKYIIPPSRDLNDIRRVAEKLLGKGFGDAPKPLVKFIKSKPAKNAYIDFERWDEVIEKELGGRHFTKFKI